MRIWEYLFLPLLCEPRRFSKGVSLSEPLWREHVRYNRVMWHSDILKKLDTLFTRTPRSNSESSREPEKNAGVLLAANSLKKKKKHLPSLFQSCEKAHGNRNDEVSIISGLHCNFGM